VIRPSQPLWSEAFRPFFLLAPFWSLLALLPVLALWFDGPVWGGLRLSPTLGHGHAMVFGFLAAALAGFLLTALPEWSGRPKIAGPRLLALWGLWLAGRIAFVLLPWLPLPLVALVDAAFLPALFTLAVPFLASNWRRFLPFLLAVAGLTILQIGFYGALLAGRDDLAGRAVLIGLDLFVLLVALAARRIGPVVLRVALIESGQAPPAIMGVSPRQSLIEFALLVFLAVDLIQPDSAAGGWVALAAACFLFDRLGDWHRGRALLRPQLLLFYLAHVWVAVGLAGLGLCWLGWFGLSPGDGLAFRHALAIGGAAGMVLVVMAIVGLRHTGRDFPLPSIIVPAAGLLTLAAILRVTVPLLLPSRMAEAGVLIPALGWSAAWILMLRRYASWFLRP